MSASDDDEDKDGDEEGEEVMDDDDEEGWRLIHLFYIMTSARKPVKNVE